MRFYTLLNYIINTFNKHFGILSQFKLCEENYVHCFLNWQFVQQEFSIYG